MCILALKSNLVTFCLHGGLVFNLELVIISIILVFWLGKICLGYGTHRAFSHLAFTALVLILASNQVEFHLPWSLSSLSAMMISTIYIMNSRFYSWFWQDLYGFWRWFCPKSLLHLCDKYTWWLNTVWCFYTLGLRPRHLNWNILILTCFRIQPVSRLAYLLFTGLNLNN